MAIPGILAKIVETKKREVAKLVENKTQLLNAAQLVKQKPLNFKEILSQTQGLAVIAEVKKASPSVGIICPDFDAVKIARAYQAGGATALSVLTDVDYFQGSPEYLKAIRAEVNLPLLRKDFIIDELQIFEALVLGADTYLLIVAILSKEELSYLIHVGKKLGMTPLVEIHDAAELAIALEVGAEIIGVNNRDLRNFTVNLGLTAELSSLVPKEVILIGESGIKTADDAAHLKRSGCRGILVGESLMRQGLQGCGVLIQEMRNC